MKFFLLALILMGTYCFAAGLDEVSDKLSPRMRQRPGLRRITQRRRDAETLYRVSNQTRQAWNHPWNYDSNKGGPKFCGNGVFWNNGGTGHPRYGGLCVEEGGCRRCGKQGVGTPIGISEVETDKCNVPGCSYGCSYSGASARYYCWRTPGGMGSKGSSVGAWCWVNKRCPSMYAHKECTPAKAWTMNCYGEREMMDDVEKEKMKKDRVNE